MHLLHHDLSLACHATTPPGMSADMLRVDPGGSLLLCRSGKDAVRADDLGGPCMFCPTGMTAWRGMIGAILGAPVVGPP